MKDRSTRKPGRWEKGRRNLASDPGVVTAMNQPEGAEMLPSARRTTTVLNRSLRRASLFARRELARELTDRLPVAVFELDAAGQLAYANPQWVAFSQCATEEPAAVIHPDDVDVYRDTLARAVEQAEPFRLIVRKRRHDGAWRTIRDEAQPLMRGGKLIGFAGYSVDVTEELETRDAAFRLGAQIQAAFRQRDVLMTEVHHRVKNNLQAILSMIGLHARRLDSQKARRDLDIVARRIRAMATIQQELHDDADVSRIDLTLYVRRVVEALARLHGRDDVSIRIDGEWADVTISTAAAVGAIIAELIANCFDHGLKPRGGSIAIDLHRDGRCAVILLRDSGAGYDEAAARLDGIGLIVAERIARHSRVVLERGVGAGMPWRLTVPLHD